MFLRIKWAFKSVKSFKTLGNDGLFPGLFLNGFTILELHLRGRSKTVLLSLSYQERGGKRYWLLYEKVLPYKIKYYRIISLPFWETSTLSMFLV